MIHHSLYIELTEKKGKGVFTAENIPEGFVIELSPVIVMKKEDRIHLEVQQI
jgi:hypothetical protein